MAAKLSFGEQTVGGTNLSPTAALNKTLLFYCGNKGRITTKSFGENDSTDYFYDNDGMRTEKKVGSTTWRYIYNGSRLVYMTNGTSAILFRYDAEGNPMCLKYKGENYFYLRNAQNDIVGIVDSAGALVVEYTYDAWGKPLSTTGSMATTLGATNPLRYRSYFYDTHTGLYYLQSRYYDPEMGRFVNVDNAMPHSGETINGYNLFAYCLNNPVNMDDVSGTWPRWVERAAMIASAVVLTAAVVVTVAAITVYTAGTGTAAAVVGASILLGATISSISAGMNSASKGKSYLNSAAGSFCGSATQNIIAAEAGSAGVAVGGIIGANVSTTVTGVMENIDPDAPNKSFSEIRNEAGISSVKAIAPSILSQGVTSAIGGVNLKTGNLTGAVSNGANGLMPSFTLGFGEALKAGFNACAEAISYYWE